MIDNQKPDGSKDRPFTHRGESSDEAAYKYCKCSRCGLAEVCTPRRDFYVIGEHAPGKPLLCADCFDKELPNHMLKLVEDAGIDSAKLRESFRKIDPDFEKE